MKKIWFIFCGLFLFFNCENSKSKSISPLSLVPDNTEILITINSSEGLENGLKNNSLIQTLGKYTQIKEFNSLFTTIYKINTKESLIALSRDNNDSLSISYIIPIQKESTPIDSITSLKIDSTYNEDGIKKIIFNNNTLYVSIKDSVLFASTKLDITKNSQKEPITNSEIETIYNTSSDDKMVSILINHDTPHLTPTPFKDSILNSIKFSKYTILDGDFSQNSISLHGITKANDSTKSLINIFKNTIAQENRVASVLPETIKCFTSLTFDRYETIVDNLHKHGLTDTLVNDFSKFQNIIEISQAKTSSQNVVILRSIDPTTTLEHFGVKTIFETYRDVPIHTLEHEPSFFNDFKFILNSASSKYFISIDDFFLFSEDIDVLKSVISGFQSGSVLSENQSYKTLKLNLSDESSLMIYGDDSELNTLLNINFTDDKKLDISNYKSNAIQYIYDTNFAHVAAVFLTHKNKSKGNSVSEEFNISIEDDLLTTPQLVTNHTNNQKDIVVQDINNNLYLISNQGKVYWKKQLDGKILGDIEQIDTYKNGRLQFVFNTSKRLYVLDRNGKNVNNFPLKFKDEITQPLSVFDYDNKKKYRLIVTQGKSIIMYDKNGDIVKGFKYKNAKNTISSQPKHFRIGRKDFIVFIHGNKMEILDRVGDQRIKVQEDIVYSKNNVYLYNNNFTTSNANGELIQISTKGKVNYKNLNVNSNHKIATTSKTLVALNDNKLTIKSKTIELDFGDYTAPKIFYINDKIYVTVTDLQSKKGFLFDSQAKPIANFPIYANSELEVDNIDNDSSLEVITKGDNSAIIVYEFQ